MSGQVSDFLSGIAETMFANEAEVETRLIEPILLHLGYTPEDIHPKHAVIFREGRNQRRTVADFAIFAGPKSDREHSLLVVEAKHPNEKLEHASAQGESYAAHLGAPFLVLTNGIDFEIWQMQVTADSERVFSTKVSRLPARWGELELLISKAASKNYAEQIRRKGVVDVNRDISTYTRAELARTENYRLAIARRLYPFGDGNGAVVMSNEFIENLDHGAVVLAPSGYGKTTLAISLLRQMLSKKGADSVESLAVEANLPEIAIAKQSILEFVQNRISSHCPSISISTLRYLLRSYGAVFLFDGYDRLRQENREALLLQIKNLRRDYPAVRPIIFSRPSNRPDLDSPVYELREYSWEERDAYIRLAVEPHQIQPFVPISLVPATLQTLFAVPLLFHLAIKYWLEHHEFSTDLNALFQSWIQSLFQSASFTPTQKIAAESALRIFARESVKGSMTASAVPPFFGRQGISADVLDALISCDALRVEGMSIELVHESLGDYLKARDIAEIEEDGLAAKLEAVPLATDSMFPVLLASMLNRREHLKVLLSRLSKADLPTYFEALRYRADLSDQITKKPDDFALIYLEDMLDGFEEPAEVFFGQVLSSLTQSLTGSPVHKMAVLGHGSTDWINFQYLPASGAARIRVGPFDDKYRFRGSNLRLLGLRPDSGRLLALRQLEEELLDLSKERRLKGGREWLSERLVGRVRLIMNISDLPIQLSDSLSDIETILSSHAGKEFVLNSFPIEVLPVDSVLHDIVALRAQGETHLNPWWKLYGNADEDALENVTNTRNLFNEYYRRVQFVYREIVEQNFSAVRHFFGFYTSMPVRWDIVLQPRHDPFRRAWMQYRWSPVATWEEAGADLEFVEELPERFKRSDFEAAQGKLRKLGRLTKYFHIWTGSGVPPSFDGSSMLGGFNGETPVVEEVCDYIADDIKRLFQGSPRADIAYFKIDR